MRCSVGDGDGFAEGVGRTEESTKFKLDVEIAAGAEEGDCGGRNDDLSVGASDGGSRDYDGGGTAVVADWEVFVVWLEGVVRSLGLYQLLPG
jgi:hypothetical protein